MYNAQLYSSEPFSKASDLQIALVIIFAYLALVGGMYILNSLALFSMSKKVNCPNAFLSFIPIASTYQLGAIAGSVKFEKKTIKNMGLWTLLSSLAFFVIFMVLWLLMVSSAYFMVHDVNRYITVFLGVYLTSLVGILITAVVLSVIQYIALYKTISRFYHNKFTPLLHTVLCGTVPLYQPILYLVLARRPLTPEATAEVEARNPEAAYLKMMKQSVSSPSIEVPTETFTENTVKTSDENSASESLEESPDNTIPEN